MMEIWQDIKGYEALYQVSDMGRIRQFKNGKEIIREGYLNKHTGYKRVSLSKNGNSKHFYIHRLVAQTFIPNPDAKPEIDHIDGCRINNTLQNLRWVTRLENLNNPVTLERLRIAFTGTNSPHYGRKRSAETCRKISVGVTKNNPMRGKLGVLCDKSLPVLQIDKNRKVVARYAGQAEAYRATGVKQGDISRVCNGKRKTAGGFYWLFEK